MNKYPSTPLNPGIVIYNFVAALLRCHFSVLAACVLILLPGKILANDFPAEGQQLNTIIVPFKGEAVKNARNYTFYIAEGNYNDYQIVNTMALAREHATGNLLTFRLPAFGRQYTWFYIYYLGGVPKYSPLMHFSTAMTRSVDTTQTRCRIKSRNVQRLKEGYVLVDNEKTIYDLDGKAVWFLGFVDGVPVNQVPARDMKLTYDHHLSCILSDGPKELDALGNVIWKAPDTNKINHGVKERYHHEFTKLKNGRYMVMGVEPLVLEWVNGKNGQFKLVQSGVKIGDDFDKKKYVKVAFGTLMEYDSMGRVVWSWRSSEFYLNQTAFKNLPPGAEPDVHENAFWYDERNKVIYVNAKGTSDILKVAYPSGKVLAQFGDGYGANKGFSKVDMFCAQHAVKLNSMGEILVFNNDLCEGNRPPKVASFTVKNEAIGALKKVWEFKYPYFNDEQKHQSSGTGGNVEPIGNDWVFMSFGLPHGNMVLVDRDKNILLDAVVENWDSSTSSWRVAAGYRVHFIHSQRELYQFLSKIE